MRILFLNSYSSVHGGAERLLFDTSSELNARDHKISIVVANDDRRSPNTEFWPSKINRYYVPELMIPLVDRYNYNRLRQTPVPASSLPAKRIRGTHSHGVSWRQTRHRSIFRKAVTPALPSRPRARFANLRIACRWC